MAFFSIAPPLSPRTSNLRLACLACLGGLLECSFREMHVGLGGCPAIGVSDMLDHVEEEKTGGQRLNIFGFTLNHAGLEYKEYKDFICGLMYT